MERSTVMLEGKQALGHVALLTLRRGVSRWSTWIFDGPDAGTTITVGPEAGCDWQIASPGVAKLAVLFTGSGLLVRSERPDRQLRLNGARLSSGWVSVEHGDRVELGPSCLEVCLTANLPKPAASKNPSAKKRRHRGDNGKPAQDHQDSGLARRKLDPEELGCGDDDAWHGAPVLFHEPRRGDTSGSLWWYAAIGLGTALAYGGWLTLLDRF